MSCRWSRRRRRSGLYEAIRDEDMQGIRERGVGVTPTPYPLSPVLPPAPGEPPFKGLQYFDVSDADLFFGREALTARLVGHIREMVDDVGAGLRLFSSRSLVKRKTCPCMFPGGGGGLGQREILGGARRGGSGLAAGRTVGGWHAAAGGQPGLAHPCLHPHRPSPRSPGGQPDAGDRIGDVPPPPWWMI